MRYFIIVILSLLNAINLQAQCIEGDCKNGKGYYFYSSDSSSYKGEFKNGKQHGVGEYNYSTGSVYNGEWKNGERNGKGVYKNIGGEIYEGEFVNDLYNGQGKYTWPSGSYYIGSFVNNMFDGEGEMHYPTGKVKKGIFKWDTLFKGEEYFIDGKATYTVFSGDTNSTLIIDGAGLIDDNTKKTISDLLWQEYERTTNTIMVMTIESLNGENLETYANQTFNRLQLGKGDKNNGLLFLIVVKDRKMRMEVGYGLEGTLPDLLTQRIQQNDVIPYFKDGNISQGILSGVQSILNNLNSPNTTSAYQSSNTTSHSNNTGLHRDAIGYSYLFVILSWILIAYWAYLGKAARLIYYILFGVCFSVMHSAIILSTFTQIPEFISGCIGFMLQVSIYIIVRKIKAGKIIPTDKKSWLHLFFEQNATTMSSSSSGGGSYSSSSSFRSSSSSSSSSSRSWSGGGSSGGGGSSSSW